MKMRIKLIALAALLAVAGIGDLRAQVPGNFITSPLGTEQINVLNSGPNIATVFLSQARDAVGYEKIVPTTGQILLVPNNISVVQMTPAAGLTALTLDTPTAPYDGQVLRVFTTQTITTFNLAASGSQTVNGNLAGSLSANTAVAYLYSLSNTTWDRIQ